jgi:hypothetical protein
MRLEHSDLVHGTCTPGVDHLCTHPNVAPPSLHWSESETLHVAVAYSNPCRWNTRRKLFHDFRRHMSTLPNVRLYVGEIVYGDRPFEVTSHDHETDFQFRVIDELWHKENVLNQIISRFPRCWKYGAYVDGDFHFTRYDVAIETVHQLQTYDWVQMFSSYGDMGPNHQCLRINRSFAARYMCGEITSEVLRSARVSTYGKPSTGIGATGGAWAFRRDSFCKVGGLLDTCVLGSGDWHMAFGLVGEPDLHPQTNELTKCGRAYANSIKIWQNRAAAALRKNVGVVDCHAIHHFHGSKSKRGYPDRWKILRDQDFDPQRDLHRDWQGLYQLAPHRIGLRDGIRGYFRSRNEDGNEI